MTRRIAASLAGAALLWSAAVALEAQDHPNMARGFAGKSFHAGDVDSINAFNGNLVVTLPLPSFHVNGGLGYGLTLVYNGNPWKIEDYDPYILAGADPRFNAGFGWRLNLGHIEPREQPEAESERDVYVAPDGSTHAFYRNLHHLDPEDAGDSGDVFDFCGASRKPQMFTYTRDGSYLRLQTTCAGGLVSSYLLEFPDGTIHDFDATGRLTKIRSRFAGANSVDVAYIVDAAQTVLRWELTDGHGRTQKVFFKTEGTFRVVDKIEVTAFGTATATYTAHYALPSIARHCRHNVPVNIMPATITVPLLVGLDLPDGTSYSMPEADYWTTNSTAPNGACVATSGAIRGLTLPTGGKISWTYRNYIYPAGSSLKVYRQVALGVATRAISGTATPWTYDTVAETGAGAQEMRNTVTDPVGTRTENYFSVYSPGFAAATDELAFGYGLPFTPKSSDGARYLSLEIFGADGQLKRTKHVRYETDARIDGLEIADRAALNQRVFRNRVVYVDDGGIAAGEVFSSFDGLGHYRARTLGGTFAGNNTRVSFVYYNHAQGTYATPDFVMWPASTPWVLGNYLFNWDDENGKIQFRSQCFDWETGFLLGERIHAGNGALASSNDVIRSFTRDTAGNVSSESYFGGDTQVIPTDVYLCDPAVNPTLVPKYRLNHTYSFGTLATSSYQGFGTQLVVNRTIDRTGLPSSSRDIAGAQTTYLYDTSGRLISAQPAQDAATTYTYTSNPAKVTVTRGTTETTAEADGFGRTVVESVRMPDNTWSARTTNYNAVDWKTFVSELGGVGGQGTTFKNFDTFGRPGIIRPADSPGPTNPHDVEVIYRGDRERQYTTKVATAAGAESNAVTLETYDRFGRLAEVKEPNNVVTRYTYDVGGRLIKVCQGASGSSCGQTREFTYDNRGFLLSEKHPEKGASGNGLVTYSGYDARGHAATMVDGPATLSFVYDGAERLTNINEFGLALKIFTYGTANSGADLRRGKLVQADRFNRPVLGGTPHNAVVRELYTYAGDHGRLSKKETRLTFDGSDVQFFNQFYTYDDLGMVASVTYPDCFNFTPCTAHPRTVSNIYTRGRLTSVPGYASAISYHSNGLINQVSHQNFVVFTQTNDPNGIPRPAALQAAIGATVHWSTGTYSYDGAGSIKAMGTQAPLYDSLSRVVSSGLLPNNEYQLYTYDNFGNRTSVSTNGAPAVTETTSTSTNRLTGGLPGTGIAEYDTAGNLKRWKPELPTGADEANYEYDSFNLMKRFKSGSEEWLYMYTANDERFWSFKVHPPGPVLPRFDRYTLRDLDGKVLREYANSGYTFGDYEDYIYRDGQLLEAVLSTGEQRHFDVDHLGSVRLVTNSAGGVPRLHRYFPYGKEQTTLGEADRMKFAGHERDLGTVGGAIPDQDDLDYMHARHYSPLTGRFLSADRLGGYHRVPQTWNRYTYVRNSPLKYVDPNGLAGIDAFLRLYYGGLNGLLGWSMKVGVNATLDSKIKGVPYAGGSTSVSVYPVFGDTSVSPGLGFTETGASLTGDISFGSVTDPLMALSISGGRVGGAHFDLAYGRGRFGGTFGLGLGIGNGATLTFPRYGLSGPLYTGDPRHYEVVTVCDQTGECTVSSTEVKAPSAVFSLSNPPPGQWSLLDGFLGGAFCIEGICA